MGCGESKHAVATTESVSVSQRTKLNSNSTKKIEAASSSEPSKQATPIDNTTTSALPDPSAPKQSPPTSTENNEEPEKTVDVKFDDGKETAALVSEQNKEAGHDRTISQETQYENANDEKSVYESPQHADVKEEDEVKKEAVEEKGEEAVKKGDENKEEIKEEEAGEPENLGEVKDKGEAATTVVAAIKEEEITLAEENKNGPAV